MLNVSRAHSDGLGIPPAAVAAPAASAIDAASDWWRLRKEGQMQESAQIAARERLVVLVGQEDKAAELERNRLVAMLIGDDNRLRFKTGLMWGGAALGLVVLAVLT